MLALVFLYVLVVFFFFFQAEDGIRDDLVTGVQTCALPIYPLNECIRRTHLHSFETRSVGRGSRSTRRFPTTRRGRRARRRSGSTRRPSITPALASMEARYIGRQARLQWGCATTLERLREIATRV